MLVGSAGNCYGVPRAKPLEGFNWYSEKKPIIKEELKLVTDPEAAEKDVNLPDYEQNIRALQAMYEKAHRRALDNPTTENLLLELALEKEMMDKSRIYGERKVAVAMMDSRFTSMKGHSNVLHRKVQDQVDSEEMFKKLSKLSQDWGLILQAREGCPHCHAFAPIVLEFAGSYGFELLAATKDGHDFEHIEGVEDNGEMLMFNPARETPMLYLIKNDGTEVLPISRGINSADQIISNIIMIDKHLRRLF